MSVLDRDALEASPLADLHVIASELAVDGFRRLRKAELIDAILAEGGGAPEPKQPAGGADEEAGADADTDAEEAPRRPRRRGGRRRGGRSGGDEASSDATRESGDKDTPAPAAGRARSGGRSRADSDRDGEDRRVTGIVEVLGNGSGFVRVAERPSEGAVPEPSDDDVYVSAAQVRRCELVSGDEVAGPVRPPRRSERYASLVRVEEINGKPADEVAEGTRFDDLPAAFPTERLALGSEDPTVKAMEWLTPFGKGSRVVIAGSARAGKTEALRRLARALAGHSDLEVAVVLAGVRPEELSDWGGDGVEPAAALSFAASADAQSQALERAIDNGRRLAARGGDAVVLVDSLTHIPAGAARRALAAARNIPDGGSLTVIATAAEPLGGETTVIALDAELAGMRRYPALDLLASGTMRPELLVGQAGAEAIAEARVQAAE
jgi:transcription termination factor Rho